MEMLESCLWSRQICTFHSDLQRARRLPCWRQHVAIFSADWFRITTAKAAGCSFSEIFGRIHRFISPWFLWHNVTKFLSQEVMQWNVDDKVFICCFIVSYVLKWTEASFSNCCRTFCLHNCSLNLCVGIFFLNSYFHYCKWAATLCFDLHFTEQKSSSK